MLSGALSIERWLYLNPLTEFKKYNINFLIIPSRAKAPHKGRADALMIVAWSGQRSAGDLLDHLCTGSSHLMVTGASDPANAGLRYLTALQGMQRHGGFRQTLNNVSDSPSPVYAHSSRDPAMKAGSFYL